jgi:hypothetical protein
VFSFGVYYLNIYLFARSPKIYKIASKMLLEDRKFSHLMRATYCKDEILLKND